LKNDITLKQQKKTSKILTEIAQDMGRSQSTLSRELTRNTGEKEYRHKQAMRLAQERHAVDSSLKCNFYK
jgi:IS30 family transposase